jgi:hypothetical protein
MSPLSTDPRKRARQLANLDRRRGTLKPDNDNARTHGGYARVAGDRMERKVAEVFDALAEDMPLKDHGGLGADAALVRVAAECLCRLEDVGAYLTAYGLVDSKTDALRTHVIDLEGKLRRELADYLDALGCSPRSRVKLGADVVHATLDAATLLSAAREEPDPDLRRSMLAAGGLLDMPEGSPDE